MGEAKRRKQLDPTFGRGPQWQQWLPPLSKGGYAAAYGLNGSEIKASVWDYKLTENISFMPIPPNEVPEPLQLLKDSLPGPESGLQILPTKMGDKGIAPLVDCLVLYGLKQIVPDWETGVEHSVAKILPAPTSANEDYVRALQNRDNFRGGLSADGLMLATVYWENYSLEHRYQDLIDWKNVIPDSHRSFFMTDGWVHFAISVR